MIQIAKPLPNLIMAAAYSCELMHMPPDFVALAMTIAYSAMVIYNLAELILNH